MKGLLFVLIVTLISGCQPTENNKKGSSSPASHETKQVQAQAKAEDDFSDLKEKDESCDTEEDLEKKIEEQAKKKEAFKLQGGDGGCDPSEAK